MRLRIAFTLTLAFTCCLRNSDVSGQNLRDTVQTSSGTLQGVTGDDVVAFKGIPYAAPPIVDARWRPPGPAAAWTGTRKADRYGSACIQTTEVAGDVSQGDPGSLNEDCLYLNIWTPKTEATAKLPVMVWIHGGAFVIGTGGLPLTDGRQLAKKGAVVVTLNYRVGPLGFFSHPALERETPGGPVNFGLLDQIAALKWVKQNIAQFGGDPANVTIFGESAGAQSVLALFASPFARGLFQKGIAQSIYAVQDMTRTKALEMGVKVSDALGLPAKTVTARQLRTVAAEKFGQLKGKGLSSSPVPISGDQVLPLPIFDTFAAGREARLPLMIGNNSDDSSVATAFGLNPGDILAKLKAAGFLVRILYPDVGNEGERARQATRDLIFAMPIKQIADQHARFASVWRYYFDYTATKLRPKFPNGVPHGGEILYVMNTGDTLPGTKFIFTDEDRKFSRLVSDYWFGFARTGKPAAEGGPAWPASSARDDKTLILGETVKVESNFMKRRLDAMIRLTRFIGRFVNRG